MTQFQANVMKSQLLLQCYVQSENVEMLKGELKHQNVSQNDNQILTGRLGLNKGKWREIPNSGLAKIQPA